MKLWQERHVDARELFSVESENALKEIKEKGLRTTVVTELTCEFDEWRIEEYLATLEKLPLDVLVILFSQDGNRKPTYRKQCEAYGALEHFATLQGKEEFEVEAGANPVAFEKFQFAYGLTVYIESFD